MIQITEIKLPINHSEQDLKIEILKELNLDINHQISYTIIRKGYDARDKVNIKFVYTVDVLLYQQENLLLKKINNSKISISPDRNYKFVTFAHKNITTRPIIIGMGPCGIFTALLLAQMGFKPLVLERGKKVRERTKDTFNLWRNSILNPESNVQFGEGGAGTFSDGKLYSQIRDPKFYKYKVLTELINAGAPEEILYSSKPHIGTFRLVSIVEKIRKKIEDLGGEIRFGSKVDDFLIENNRIKGVVLSSKEQIMSKFVVVAIGHSARDTFKNIYKKNIFMEAKPFSIGFRIEHPQSLINKARFGNHANTNLLGAADYKLVHHTSNNRTVYSFCMCPGGSVVAATSEENKVVTNGMSQYSRNEHNANSGIVVSLTTNDFPLGTLSGIEFQERLEKNAFILGGSNYNAPGQLLGDFLNNNSSTSFGTVIPSYKPGVTLTNLNNSVPNYISESIKEAIPVFDRQITGFAKFDAVLTGVETRTSSPVRITRNQNYQSINTYGLYPAGEGAGYAGGILSAAIDGIEVAEALALEMNKI